MLTKRALHIAAALIAATLLAVYAVPWATSGIRADQQTYALAAGDTLTITCETKLTGRVRRNSATLQCIENPQTAPTATTAPVIATATPLPPTATAAPSAPTATTAPGGETPVAGQLCPAWVHDRYVAVGPDGRSYPTWHPPTDPEYGCYFGHEHGSDPRQYVGFASSGMPLFGYTAAQMGMDEPHNGFKVFVTNDDLNGRAWMITLHQGTGGPRRALESHHTLDWHISTRSGEQLVNVRLMADFGYASPNCRGDEAIPGSTAAYPFSQHNSARRFIPTTDCAQETPYEIWSADVNVAGLFAANPSFDIDNPTTVINPADLTQVRYMCEFRSPNEDCTSPNTQWASTKRGVIHPGQYVASRSGGTEVWTDAHGHPAAAGAPGAIRQYITTNGWDNRICCGNEVVFRIQSYSNGVYIANPGEQAGSAEFGDGNVRWPN
jgi:hypothetical protein